MMRLELTKERARFHAGDCVAGEMVLDDPFKPYLHPVRSPAGHEVTVAMPGDHRHHKGLMYALRCPDVNFWEENPGSGSCGVQEIQGNETSQHGEEVILQQSILWREEGGGLETYREKRTIGCRLRGDEKAFVWRWESQRKALRDHILQKSEWSLEVPDGRKINYHGLGIRLPWMWAFGGDTFNGVEIAGKPIDPLAACGTSGPEVTWWGRIDGHWDSPMAAVTLRQPASQGFTWFVLKGDFAYLAVGPSNAEERVVKAGESINESYEIIVEDRT